MSALITDSPRVRVGAVVGGLGGGVCFALGHGSLVSGPLAGALGGAVFARIARERVHGPGEGLIWGLAFAFLLWLAVPAGLGPWLTSRAGACDLGSVRDHVPELIGHLVCIGAPLGLTLGILVARQRGAAVRGVFSLGRAIAVGGLAGIVGSWVFDHLGSSALSPFVSESAPSTVWTSVQQVVGAACIGASYGFLFQRASRGLGPCMGWGLAYGMLWWFLGPMTALPLLRGQGLDWSAGAAAEQYGLLVAHVFFGVLLGLVHAALDKLWVAFFIESDPLHREKQGVGTRAVLALLWGAMGGIAGGLVFSLAMLDTGILPYVASLAGGTSLWLGFVVHLGISVLIGMAYGLLFAREVRDLGTALGWGLLYGLLWWFLGPLTWFPHLLGEPFDWSIAGAGTALPALIGHLAYGATTAFVLTALELLHGRRHDPRLHSARAKSATGAESAAPALWVFALGLGVLLPIVLG